MHNIAIRQDKKGFTLVELIVVLVILAILAAILIPSMVGWIDKANEKTALVEGRTILVAAQTLASERYADLPDNQKTNQVALEDKGAEAIKLAGIGGSFGIGEDPTFDMTDGKCIPYHFVFISESGYKIEYSSKTEPKFTITKK